MNFTQLHERLRLELLRRIQRGTVSVSLLARQTGFGQSHLSNYLHGRRQLSLEAMDRILSAQHLAIADLMPAHARRTAWHVSDEESNAVPVVSYQAALYEPNIRQAVAQDMLHLPVGVLRTARARASHARRSWQRFVAIMIAAQEAEPMEPLILPGATVLLDRHYNSLAQYRPNRPNVYAVRHDSRLKLCYLDFQSNRLVLRPHSLAFPVELIEMGAGESPNEMIAGRVALILNEL